MQIILSPLASEYTTQVSINGLIITVDGTEYDLSKIPEGGSAEASDDSPFFGTLTRDKVTVKYHYDIFKAEENQSTNWDDYTFEVEEGEVPCPIKWKPEPQPEATLDDFQFEEEDGFLVPAITKDEIQEVFNNLNNGGFEE